MRLLYAPHVARTVRRLRANPRAGSTSCTTINRSHAHTPTERTPPTPAHTRARQDPQTNTSHKHLTTLNGGATTVRATSHARVGGRAEVSMRGRVEV